MASNHHTVAARHLPGAKQAFTRLLPLGLVFYTLTLVVPHTHVHACGLEPVLNGGFTVSHPDSLDVAVAVANARQDGLLPGKSNDRASNEMILMSMITALQQMRKRLKAGGMTKASTGSFSVVLVGPGFWSHFQPTSEGLQALHHARGPMIDRPVVVTHYEVIKALLQNKMEFATAVDLGLVIFAGKDSMQVETAFKASLAENKNIALNNH